jgi:hypothetical protein
MERQISVRTRNIHVLMRISGRERKSKLPGRAAVFIYLKILTSFQRWKKGICGVNMAWGCWNQTVVVVAMRVGKLLVVMKVVWEGVGVIRDQVRMLVICWARNQVRFFFYNFAILVGLLSLKMVMALGVKVDGEEELGCVVAGLGCEEDVQLGVEALRELLWGVQL